MIRDFLEQNLGLVSLESGKLGANPTWFDRYTYRLANHSAYAFLCLGRAIDLIYEHEDLRKRLLEVDSAVREKVLMCVASGIFNNEIEY